MTQLNYLSQQLQVRIKSEVSNHALKTPKSNKVIKILVLKLFLSVFYYQFTWISSNLLDLRIILLDSLTQKPQLRTKIHKIEVSHIISEKKPIKY